MDKKGFRTMLEGRNVPAEKMDSALAMAERFEHYCEESGGFFTQTCRDFSKRLIEEGQNTRENFMTLARYGLFIRVDTVFVAFLEILDGGEAQENLYKRVSERFGDSVRDEVFASIGVAPYGLPTPEKPKYMHPVIERLRQAAGEEACRDLLSDSLRDLPDEYYVKERDLYLSSEDVDDYISHKKRRFVEQLEACQREERLFFAQEVTDEVLDFVRNEPEIGGGVREGHIVYETKIPFNTRDYLAETDPNMKRYHYCHCPWAREAVRTGEPVAPIFCNCSAGFHKKPWEAALGQKVKVDVLESILNGDMRCRFAIHLPETR
jgi:hypothetical protein